MHRSRLFVPMILAVVAACSARDDSEATELLARDSTLVALLARDQGTRQPALPDACGAVTVAAQPAAANSAEAEKLTRRASEAETLGNLEEAKTLLLRATELDGTSKSAAYQLGLTSEALGDRTAATTAYCRYLALTSDSTAGAAEVRQRVARLSQPERQVATASVGDRAPAPRREPAPPARRVTRARPAAEQPTVEPRVVASANVEQTVPQAVPAASSERATPSSAAVTASASDSSPSDTMADAPNGDGGDVATAGGEVIATSRPVPAVDPAATTSRTESRGPSRAQSAGIGAAAGAIIGAVTGRSVKGALIGAAAGGIIGTAAGGRVRTSGSWH